MIESKGWNWKIVKDDKAEIWKKPSVESYYLLNRWKEQGKKHFLDLGCGLGRHSILFGKNGFDVSSFDISQEAINRTKEWAKEENLTFDYKVGDMLNLPYKNEQFNMSKKVNRNFKVGDEIYVVDHWGTSKGSAAFEAYAQIIQVNQEKQNFLAVLYGDTYQTYSFKDYGRLIFDTKRKASQIAYFLPKPTSIVWQIIGNRVYKKTVLGISSRYINGATDLVIKLNRGKEVSTKEMDSTIFMNEQDARRKIAK